MKDWSNSWHNFNKPTSINTEILTILKANLKHTTRWKKKSWRKLRNNSRNWENNSSWGMNMTLKIFRSWRDRRWKSRMIGPIPEVIPVRTKIPNPLDREVSPAMEKMTSKTNRTPKKKAPAKKSKTRTTTMTTVIFDPVNTSSTSITYPSAPYKLQHPLVHIFKSRHKQSRSVLVTLPADVDVVHIGSLLLIRSNRNRWSNGWLGNLLHFHIPLILRFLQICQPEFRLPVGYHHIDPVLTQHPVHLWYHLVRISSWILPALNQPICTNTESRVALSTTASKEASGKSIALTSMSKYLKFSLLSLYFSFMALMQMLDISILVMVPYPSSNISSLSRELPEPTLSTLLALSTWVVMISLSPLYLWYQSKG